MKKYIWGLVALIVIVGGYFTLSNKSVVTETSDTTSSSTTLPKKTPASNPTDLIQPINSASIVVNYTDLGFVPPTISIKAGDTVRFVNQSSGSMWVASDPHPSHGGYPGFDEKQVVMRGGIYEFMFNARGTWGYHNHIDAKQKGIVVVK